MWWVDHLRGGGVIERSRKENKGKMLAQIKGLGRDRVRGLKNIRV